MKYNFENSNGKSGSVQANNEIDAICNMVGKEYDSVFLEVYGKEYVYFKMNGDEITVTAA
jgi:hypothetical protein